MVKNLSLNLNSRRRPIKIDCLAIKDILPGNSKEGKVIIDRVGLGRSEEQTSRQVSEVVYRKKIPSSTIT